METQLGGLRSMALSISNFCEEKHVSSEKDLCAFALDETVKHIIDGSVRLKCSVLTRTKALLIYHYFKRCVHETNYDSFLVAAACVSLSIKFNEEPVEFDCIILVFFCLVEQGVQRHTTDEKFKQMKKSLTLMECHVMRMLEFSLNHKLAHEFLLYFLHDLREELSVYNIWDTMCETCTRLASDFYLSEKCLNYKAEDIATTVIQVALYLQGINAHKDECYLKTWLKALSYCPDKKKFDIIEDIFMICDLGPAAESQKQEMKNSG